MESILDDALALNMPQSHLLWHYRSRHESLIAFSNNRFYNNKLYTFPSINDRESKVTLVSVGGFFDRGKSRQNRAEAEAVVSELIRRSQDPACSEQSVGVVSFNIQQQNLIDDLFTEACKLNPELERWAYEAAEPIFIKNLENVQGDERDVILFSIGYGPDASGKVYMNFGPLNREGGWRRLNVAVSRARQEMKVFSSIRADQIDLSRTSAEGVAALRAFLDYASGAALSENDQTLSKSGDGKSGIADALKRKLEQKGYQVQLRVGHSKYKIDLGIVKPEAPNQYLLGILLDGPAYKASKTTRDREISQISVLRGLGWRIHRLWSVDWWDNSEKEFNKIIELLKTPMPCPVSLPPKSISDADNSTLPVPQEKFANLHREDNAFPKPHAPGPVVEQYHPSVLPVQPMTPEEYLLPQRESDIKNAIMSVLEQEAPISESLLTRRVVQSFAISRAGSRIQQKTAEILSNIRLTCTTQENRNYYWLASQNPDEYTGFRASASGVRDAGDIPVQEVANAVRATLEQQIAMPKDELLRETANLLGYSRLGNVVISSVTAGIEYAVKKGRIAEQKDDYYVMI